MKATVLCFDRTVGAMSAAIFCGAILAGCQDGHGPEKGAGPEPAASLEKRAADDLTGHLTLTQRQREVLRRIEEAGGTFDGQGKSVPTSIDLASDRVFADDELIRSLVEFPRLRRLRVSAATATPDAFEALEQLTELTALALQDAPLDDERLANLLGATPNLKHLTLRRVSEVSDEILTALARCPGLEQLALIEMNKITGQALSGLSRLDSLRSLDLRNCGNLAAGDFEHLDALDQLVELKLAGPLFNDELLSLVAGHPRISSLTIEDAEVSAACLQRLAAEPAFAQRLRSLSFSRCFAVSDETLATLAQFPRLASLSLRKIFITGSFIVLLAESDSDPPPLRTLILRDGFVTDESLAALPDAFPQLERLDLSGNAGVTDASRNVFDKLLNLQQLQLENTGVSVPPDLRARTRKDVTVQPS